MVLEISAMETEIEISLPKSNADRPQRFPCSECGRTFTKLGYIYHKKTCSEKEDCRCAACAISGKTLGKPRVEQSVTNESFYRVLNDRSVNNTSDYSSGTSDNITDNSFGNNSFEDLNDSDDNLNTNGNHEAFKSSDNLKNVDENSVDLNITSVNKEIVVFDAAIDFKEESQSSMSTIIDEDTSETIISSQSDGFHNAITKFEGLEDDKLNEKAYVYAEISEIGKDHDGRPCTRKLYCSQCEQHIYWEQFGLHILQHGTKLDSGYIKCPECTKNYSRPTMLLLHYFIHVSVHPLDCESCHCHFEKCIDINATARTVNEHCYAENYHCYICLKVFSHEQSIANHMRLHSEEMPYRCKECDRCFRQVGNLQRHMATHRGDKPHQCANCPKSFADPATLRNHVRVHTGETPYVCTMCKRGFTQVGNLKRHMVLHLKNKPSESPGVQKNKLIVKGIVLNPDILIENEVKPESSTSANEAMHVDDQISDTSQENLSAADESISSNSSKDKVPSILKSSRGRKRNGHFKIFACPDCNKIYTWKHDLQVHIRTHTGEKPYACDICDKRFAQSGAVRTHLARHHNEKTSKRKKSAK